MNERQKSNSSFLQNVMLSLTENQKVDSWLTQYVEVIRKGTNSQTIDIETFKRIAWPAGMPYIVLDLIIYLTGGQSNATLEDLC